MRRIINACLLQTMRFDISKEANPERDLEEYFKKLDKKGVKYIMESKEIEDDKSIVIKIKKQYNDYKSDSYMD